MASPRVLVKTLVFTLLVPGLVVVGLPWLLLRSADGPRLALGAARWLGLLPVLSGAVVYLWTAWDFGEQEGTPAPIDEPRRLVTADLYERVRNPMYVGVLLVLVGEVVLFASLVLLAYAVAVWLAFHLFVVGYEEPHLRRKFGREYVDYCERVPRWLPRLRVEPGRR